MKNEIWAEIKGFEGKYQVSNLGRVKSLGGRKGCRNDRFLKPKFDKDGYGMVDLGKYFRNRRVHRLVAEAFVSNPIGLSTINHIDGDKRNNSVENLEWCTPGDNTRHALMLGLSVVRGSANGNSKLEASHVREIRKLRKQGVKLGVIANQFGIRECTVSAIAHRRLWEHLEDTG